MQGFVSYSHQDADMVLNLFKYLKVATKPCGVDLWIDKEIRIGDKWDEKIRAALAKTEIFVFCISVDFIESQYIQEVELKEARAKHDRDEALIFPVLIRACPYEAIEFIKDLQLLPEGAKPIRSIRDRDDAFTKVARAIAKRLKERMEPA